MSRPWVRLLLAIGSSLGFFTLRVGGSLASTLAILPLVLLGLLEVEHWCRRRGGNPVPGWQTRSETVALALLIALALGHSRLGLVFPDSIAMAGLALLLTTRSLRLARSIPLFRATRSALRETWPFLLLPLVVYLALLPWSTEHRAPDGDEPWYLLVTHSLAHDLDIDLTNNYRDGDSLSFMHRRIEPQPGDPIGNEGQLYSRHNSLLPLLLAPAYRIAGKSGALATMAIIAALTAWQFLLFVRRLFPDSPRGARFAWMTLAFAPPLLLYSYQVWVELPGALLTILALRVLQRAPSPGKASTSVLRLLLLLVLLPLLKLRFVLVAIGLGALFCLRLRPPRRVLVAAAGTALLAVFALLMFNQFAFGNPLKGRSWEVIQIFGRPPVAFVKGLTGLFFDASFGLFAAAPLWVLIIPALFLLARSKPRMLLHGAILGAPYLLFIVADPAWFGGWSPPFRYAMVLLPVVAALLVPLLDREITSGGRLLLTLLLASTIILTTLWILVPGWTYNFAMGRSRILDHLSQIVGADVARFFPSSVRPRLATWIWPPLATLGSLALWRLDWPRQRRASVLGLLALLVAIPALLVSAASLPTRMLELEDPLARQGQGELFPDLWEPTRTALPGGWRLWEGEQTSLRLVPAAGEVDLEVLLYFSERSGEVELEVFSEEQVLATARLDDPWRWQQLRLTRIDWPSGASRIGFRLRGDGQGQARSDIILDRARFRWR